MQIELLKKTAILPNQVNHMREMVAKNINARILKTRVEMKEEQNRLDILNRKADQIAMKEAGCYPGSIIVLPQYKFNENLNLHEEISIPPRSLFIEVGYNNLQTIRKIMNGCDDERRH